jgi:hypothetical protein
MANQKKIALKKPLVIEINHGIACRIGNKIYINKSIKKWSPKLHKAILLHENKHTDGLSMKDIELDLKNSEISDLKREYYSFVLSNPSSWTELLPVFKYDGNWVVNPMILAMWVITGGLICLVAVLSS